MDTENKKRIAIFLIVTFALTYSVEIFLIMPMVGSVDINQAMLAQLMVAGVMFLPAVGALITRFWTKEKMTRENTYLALHLKGKLKYYALAWFGSMLLIAAGAVIYFLIFPTQFDANMGYAKAIFQTQAQISGVEVTDEQIRMTVWAQVALGIFAAPILNFFSCFGEEWGWRGYLLPKLQKQMPIIPTLLISGVIWGLWHVPLTIMGHNYGMGYAGYPVTGILAMCLFCTTTGILLSYVTIRTGSCIPAVLGHGALNGLALTGLYFTSLENPYNILLGPAPVGVIGGAGFLITAVILLIRLHKEEKEK